MYRTAVVPSRTRQPILLCALAVVLLLAASSSNSSAGSGDAASLINGRLKGNYSCILQGVNTLPTGENVNVHAIATFRADGKGKITASEKVSVLASKDGTYATCKYQLSSGTYTIGATGGGVGRSTVPFTWDLEYTGDANNDAQHCLGTKETSSLLIAGHGKTVYVTPVLGSELVLGGTCEAQ